MGPVRHPFVPIAVAFATGIALESAARLPIWGLLVACPIAAGLAVVGTLEGERRAPLAAGLFAILLAGALWCALDAKPRSDDLSLAALERPALVRLRARAREVPLPPHPEEPDARAEPFVIDLTAVECGASWRAASGGALLRIAAGGEGIAPGDELEILCAVRRPRGRTAPGGYDRREALAREGIGLEADSPGGTVRVLSRGCALSPRRMAFAVRSRLAGALRAALPPRESELLMALLLGHRPGIDPADRARFSRSGLGHVLAVSGLHLAILAGLAGWLLRRAGLGERAAAGVLVSFAIFYAMLAGMRPPVLRAAAMISTHLAATILGRDRDARNSVALAAFGLLVWRPLWLFDPGFQLSFAAVAFLAFLYPLLEETYSAWRLGVEEWMEPLPENRFERAVRRVRQAAFVSLAAWAGVQPLLLHYLGFLNPWAVLSNVVVLPLATVALGGGVVLLAAAAWPPLAAILAPPARAGLWALLTGAELFARLPWSAVWVTSPGPVWLLGYYGLALALFTWADRRGVRATGEGREPPRRERFHRAVVARLAAALAALVVSAAVFAALGRERSFAPSLTVFDMGRSRAALVKTASRADILVNAGSPGRDDGLARKLLESARGRLAAAILIGDDEERASGLAAVIEDVGVDILAIRGGSPPSELAREAAASAEKGGASAIWPRPGDELSSSGGVRVAWYELGPLETIVVDAGQGLRIAFVDASPERSPRAGGPVHRRSWPVPRGVATLQAGGPEEPAEPAGGPARARGSAERPCDLLVVCGSRGGIEAGREAARALRPLAALSAFSGTEVAFEGPAGFLAALAEEGVPVLRVDEEGTLRARLDRGSIAIERWDGSAWATRLRLAPR